MIELSVSCFEYPEEIKELAGKDHQLLLTSQKEREPASCWKKTPPLSIFAKK